MPLVDIIEAKDIEQLNQYVRAWIDQLKAVVQELRDETKVRVIVEFETKAKQ